MKTRRVLLGWIVGLALLGATAAFAGECAEGREDYVLKLEAGPGVEGFDYAIWCVDYDSSRPGALWAGPASSLST
jgi:hypothetical protein